jgi:large subunit ribosomal protein L35
MPKMKTKSAAKKRFKVTASGKVLSKGAFARHMMRNKSQKMKRQSRGTHVMHPADAKKVLINFLPYLRSKIRKLRPTATITAEVEK